MRKLAALGLAVYAVPVMAWGPEGHRLVARLAQGMLTPAAAARVQDTLGPGETIASLASWADQVRPSRKETEPWHFVDIPIDSAGLDMQRDCSRGDCVLGKIAEFRRAWRDPNASPQRRREALLFLVHFMGDMHQPLHCSDHRDRGGNDVHVLFFGSRMNLHRVWDSGLLDRLAPEEQLFRILSAALTPRRRAEWSRGTVDDWAAESFAVARRVVYGDLPPGGREPSLGAAYERDADPVLEEQIEKAGVRLAAVLNETP